VAAPTLERKTLLIQGLRFESCLEQNRLREVWRAIGPEGKPRLVTYIKGFAVTPDAPAPVLAEQRLTCVRHPYLLSVEAVVPEGGRVVLIPGRRTVPGQNIFGLRRWKARMACGARNS
jgi:hypothetical protein